ncbi:MAG: hypothetical protein BRD45_05125 [Bacteroidetes bacterium QS_8_64_10]|nr:MAG: hypothetical protein BRD45_05125 [Bacteroidetes bacterium QS_8_64_10]
MRNALLLTILALLVGLASVPARAQQAPGAQPATAAPPAVTETPPDAFVLSSAYPNPFQSATRFSVTMRERKKVRVKVFNVLGRRVKTLYEGVLPAGATRTFVLKAGDLPNGLYLYRVTSDQRAATRQVTLSR